MPIPRLTASSTALLVVDLQVKLLPHIHEHEQLLDRVSRLIRGCITLDIPILATEQYPQGLGPTVESIRSLLPADCPIEGKVKFSAFIEPIRKRLAELRRTTVIVCGVESHVCILQTCFDLLSAGCLAAVAVDAVSSRRPVDHDTALTRLTQSGAIPTTSESALLELAGHAGSDTFKQLLPIIR